MIIVNPNMRATVIKMIMICSWVICDVMPSASASITLPNCSSVAWGSGLPRAPCSSST
jgi:hypothetical protein